MLRHLARRLAAMVRLVLGTTLLVFVLGRLAPGDPVQILFGDLGDAASVDRARAQLGLQMDNPDVVRMSASVVVQPSPGGRT